MKKVRVRHGTTLDESKLEKPKKKLARVSPTPEGREKQLISLTIDLAEAQIRAGTASSQVMTHFLKLASTKEELEKQKLVQENLLLMAKTESLKSTKRSEELLSEALTAFGIYSGKTTSKVEKSDD